jgi:hypothetical protein
VGFLGQVGVVSFETERDEPLAGRLLLYGDFFGSCFVGGLAVVADRDIFDFREPECRVSVTRVFEFEARLRIRQTLELPR